MVLPDLLPDRRGLGLNQVKTIGYALNNTNIPEILHLVDHMSHKFQRLLSNHAHYIWIAPRLLKSQTYTLATSSMTVIIIFP